ncbi:protein THEM6-like [Hyposmocoma kahamanoa]|uniref:protein THEM6-like n=1 Tax=Hyposmocoma kahamanoa TaxID=1477025 RepID=UPI000E6D6302|nr:protein THEM6-like [Hyposmocoma kahamanoa]
MLYILLFIIVLYICIDVNYVVRTFFAVLSGRFTENKCSLDDTTTVYGICTFQDCDVTFKFIRSARLLRDLDFARYHFYDRTGIFQRSQDLKIKSLQGCTLILIADPVPLFSFYKINTKLVYWDNRSLFLEHEVITLRDGKLRAFLVSRQHGIGQNGESIEALLSGLAGFQNIKPCPDYIRHWLKSMKISSEKLRRQN